MFQRELREIAKDSDEKHTWCAERIEAKWGLNRVGRRMVKNEVRKVADKSGHDKDADFYSKW